MNGSELISLPSFIKQILKKGTHPSIKNPASYIAPRELSVISLLGEMKEKMEKMKKTRGEEEERNTKEKKGRRRTIKKKKGEKKKRKRGEEVRKGESEKRKRTHPFFH